MTTYDIDNKLARAQKAFDEVKRALDQAQEEKKKFEDESPERKLAILLHERTCHWNHTDGCGWYYEIDKKGVHNWIGSTHQTYLNRTRNIVRECEGLGLDLAATEKIADIILKRHWL